MKIPMRFTIGRAKERLDPRVCEFYSLETTRKDSECLHWTSTRNFPSRYFFFLVIVLLRSNNFWLFTNIGAKTSFDIANQPCWCLYQTKRWAQSATCMCRSRSKIQNSLSQSSKEGNEIIFRSVIFIQVITALLARRKFYKFFKNKRFLALKVILVERKKGERLKSEKDRKKWFRRREENK